MEKNLSTGLALVRIICTYELSTRLASIATPYTKDIRYTLSSNSTSIHLDVVVRALLPADGAQQIKLRNCSRPKCDAFFSAKIREERR